MTAKKSFSHANPAMSFISNSVEKENDEQLEIEILNDGKLIYKHGGFNNNFSAGFLFSADTKNGYVFFANNESAYELILFFKSIF